MKKKSQVKFGETFGVIVIVYIVIVMGFNWYNDANNKSVLELLENDRYERAFEVYYYIVNSDLIHVSERGVVDSEIDLVGLRAFAEFSQGDNREYLRKQLGRSFVNISLFNYSNVRSNNFEASEQLILYDNSPDVWGDRERFVTLVPVVNRFDKRVDLGILEVYVFLDE